MKSLQQARELVAALPALPAADTPLQDAVGGILAEPVRTRLPLPHTDTSAMDGWALAAPRRQEVGGRLSWQVRRPGAEHPGTRLPALEAGEAIGVVTGSPVPAGTVSVLRSEHSRLEPTDTVRHSSPEGERESTGTLTALPETPDLQPGRNIRPAGVEAPAGQELLAAGDTLTPVRTAVAAVAGYDTVRIHPVPRVQILTTGSEVISAGLPEPGQVRDTFTLSLPGMVADLGGAVTTVTRLDDDVTGLHEELTATAAHLVLTTGGTAHSRADTLRPALQRCGAEILIDSVDMRPGHPVLLARLPSGTLVLGLPGNPLAGFAALTLLGRPLLGALRGVPAPECAEVFTASAGEDLEPARRGQRLLPVRRTGGSIRSAGFSRPHMMRGLAYAEAFAVIPPRGIQTGEPVTCHPVPGHHLPPHPRRAPWDD
ncbi:molybdopterin molybdotransferase MoeA [Nesterenkonia flava]|uniref:Molybdopterin molybdenumtransferase n=1 Tax=Nesterenkonia flava TaxID=469799 RepID=A0ABU1FRE8_9MICC|nr:molybdopterin molybdotransferase MoeA [Nesterenkonia flava]MDR5711235.1 molybdopterin molybdotransferase MoeA [Nesterenkonia flava]